MLLQPPIGGPNSGPGGFDPRATVRIKAINRTGSTALAGQVVVLDMVVSATEVVSGASIGSSTHAMSNFVTPSKTVSRSAGIACVVEDASIADNAAGNLVLSGVVSADVVATTGSVKPGEPLIVTSTGVLNRVMSSNHKVFAIALQEHITTPTGKAKKNVLFNGFGFPTPAPPSTLASGV